MKPNEELKEEFDFLNRVIAAGEKAKANPGLLWEKLDGTVEHIKPELMDPELDLAIKTRLKKVQNELDKQ